MWVVLALTGGLGWAGLQRTLLAGPNLAQLRKDHGVKRVEVGKLAISVALLVRELGRLANLSREE